MASAGNKDKENNIEIDVVFKTECAVINKQREIRSKATHEDEMPQLGLAFSGGGIRSASFALGVTQALDRYQLFDEVDYLSTVSGGGYMGSAITWFHHQQTEKREGSGPELVNDSDNEFILGKKSIGTRATLVECEHKDEENNFLSYIRQHGDYLTPGKRLNSLSMVAQVLANSLIAVLVYFSLLLSGMFALTYIGFFEKDGWSIFNFENTTPVVILALLLIFFSTVIAIISSVSSCDKTEDTEKGYKRRVRTQKIFGYLMVATLLLLALASMGVLQDFLKEKSYFGSEVAGLIPLLIGGIGTLLELSNMRSVKVVKRKISNIRIWVLSLLLIYGLFYASYLIAYHYKNDALFATIATLAIGSFFGWFTNLNLFGINRMYRDRLMEAFMPNTSSVEKNQWAPATKADQAMVVDMCGNGVFSKNTDGTIDVNLKKIKSAGPYHIINTNIVLNDSDIAKFRGRGGDNFVISPAYSGSDSVNWHPTLDFVDGKMSHATAMAISGAALNPGTGVGGLGTTRNKLISFMMAFFHLRLGWWLTNPNARNKNKFFKKPNFIVPGLTQGVFAYNNKEDSTFIELTDGGHFENTGIYELIRRKLPIIMLSQAGADPKFTLEDIANVMERVRVDFGVTISFLDDYGLNAILPNGDNNADAIEKKFNLSKKGFAIAKVKYPDKEKLGYLIVIKSLMIKDLPLSLFHYKSVNTDFPNQTTADQFFDENQFEAYRELGYQLTKQMAEEVCKTSEDAKSITLTELQTSLASLATRKSK
ncbi:MAG: patatin-like phospholipase family protein [Cocleimonas sp.]|nr:patatin-like phospholipase family protein [Cocleimonas sp.]